MATTAQLSHITAALDLVVSTDPATMAVLEKAFAAVDAMAPKPKAAPGPRAYKPKPSSLNANQRSALAGAWERAVNEPGKWREGLARRTADVMGYGHSSDSVFAAWGLSADGRTPLPQFA